MDSMKHGALANTGSPDGPKHEDQQLPTALEQVTAGRANDPEVRR
jgi:hypothetical protein